MIAHNLGSNDPSAIIFGMWYTATQLCIILQWLLQKVFDLANHFFIFVGGVVLHPRTPQWDFQNMRLIIGERSEPLSRVFNDQPRDIYIWWCPYVRTKCKLLNLQTQALLADYSTNVCHTCPLTFNDSYNPFKVERKF